jgi:hypothetical protein
MKVTVLRLVLLVPRNCRTRKLLQRLKKAAGTLLIQTDIGYRVETGRARGCAVKF